MHKELVEEKRWLSDEHFLHALNFTMLLPGPEAQQLATYLGWRLHGAKGGIAAGALFVLPSVLILFALSWLYMAGGHLDWVAGLFHGLVPAVIAIVFCAAKRIGSKALKTPALWVVALFSLIAIRFLAIPFPLIIIGAGLIGWLGSRRYPTQFPAGKGHKAISDIKPALILPPAPKASWPRSLRISAVCLTLWWLPVIALGLSLGWKSIHAQEGIFFSKAALVTFGGAYAVLPYVAQQAVETHGWLDQAQMIAGLGLAETTPGPLIMVLQFVGFVGAWQNPGDFSPLASATLGAAITTWVTFLPCFLFVFLGAPHVEGLGEKPALSATLNAITAAVVGVILNLALWFTWHAFQPEAGRIDYFVIILAIAAWFAIEKMKLDVLPLLGICALLGLGYSFL